MKAEITIRIYKQRIQEIYRFNNVKNIDYTKELKFISNKNNAIKIEIKELKRSIKPLLL